MFENPRRGRQARDFTTNVPKIVDLKSSSEQIFSENCRWVPLNIGRTGDMKVPQYSFSGSIPAKSEHKLRRHKQTFGKIATTVVLDKDENLP